MEEKNEMRDLNVEDCKIEDIVTESGLEVIDPLDTLINHNFGEGDLNLDESYEMISLLERDKDSLKMLEAEEVIKSIGRVYINAEYKQKVEDSINNVKSFFNKYNVENKEFAETVTEKEKDKLFAISSFLLKNIYKMTDELIYDFNIKVEEFDFMLDVLERKLTYDSNDVFNLVDLNMKLKEWHKISKSLPKGANSFVISVNIKEVVIIYHFLQKHSIKGITKDFYLFLTTLNKIAEMHKIYNAYGVIRDRLNTDFTIWNSAITELNQPEVEPKLNQPGDGPNIQTGNVTNQSEDGKTIIRSEAK
jgi:hypothetical protein